MVLIALSSHHNNVPINLVSPSDCLGLIISARLGLSLTDFTNGVIRRKVSTSETHIHIVPTVQSLPSLTLVFVRLRDLKLSAYLWTLSVGSSFLLR